MQFILCQTLFVLGGAGVGGRCNGIHLQRNLSRNDATKLRDKLPEKCRYSIFFLTSVLPFFKVSSLY